MSDRPLRQRLEDVREELEEIDADLPEPLTLAPALRSLETARDAIDRLDDDE